MLANVDLISTLIVLPFAYWPTLVEEVTSVLFAITAKDVSVSPPCTPPMNSYVPSAVGFYASKTIDHCVGPSTPLKTGSICPKTMVPVITELTCAMLAVTRPAT